jgi:hypothetical protein
MICQVAASGCDFDAAAVLYYYFFNASATIPLLALFTNTYIHYSSVPEPLVGKAKALCESVGMISLLDTFAKGQGQGEYRCRCLVSRTWLLREAALTKVGMLRGEGAFDSSGLAQTLPALAAIVKLGVEDKIQQVLFGAVQLMEGVLKDAHSARLTRPTVGPLFDPVTIQLVDKLNDGNQRLREGGRKGYEV